MVNGYKLPQLGVPEWLERAIDLLNWDILTWKVYVGDGIRNILYWLLGQENTTNELIGSSLNALDDRISSAQAETTARLWDIWNTLWPIINKLETLPDYLNEWWAAKLDQVWAMVMVPIEEVSKRVTHLEGMVDVLRRFTLLLSEEKSEQITQINFSVVNLGAAIESMNHRWDEHKNLFQWLWLFFADPTLFFYQVGEEMLVRFF